MEHPLKRWRQGQGLSLDALAIQVNASKAQLSRVENGNADPSVSLIRRICEASDGAVTPGDFFDFQKAS